MGHSKWEERIAEWGGLAGGEDDADLWETHAESGDQLDEAAIIERECAIRGILIIAGVGAHAGEGDGKAGLPAMFHEVVEMGRKGEGLVFPIGQAEERADADASKSSVVGPFRAIETPVEFFLGPGGVEDFVGFPVIGFLINNEPFRAVFDKIAVLVVFHGPYFNPDGGDEVLQRINAFLKIAV